VDRTLTRNGGLSYLEIPAIEPRKSAAFYGKLFGWRIENAKSDQPKFMAPSGHLLGRWITGRAISRKPGLLPYFYVDAIETVIRRVPKNGGEIVKPVCEEGNIWVAIVRDPAGNLLGIWQERAA
jgi:predicted enzyme related to lactoylglutathione lyase